MESGADRVLTKPLDIDELMLTIRHKLQPIDGYVADRKSSLFITE